MGLEDVDDVYTRITNGVRDAILPDVTIFVKYTLEDGEIIKMEIGEGSYKPYYLKVKGLKPSGVYVRQGTSAVPASPEQIRLMIKNADGDVFEDLRSLEQELTFQAAAKAFARHGLDLRPEKYDALCSLVGSEMCIRDRMYPYHQSGRLFRCGEHHIPRPPGVFGLPSGTIG